MLKSPNLSQRLVLFVLTHCAYIRSSLCLFYRCIFHNHLQQRLGMKSHRSVALEFILLIHPFSVVSFFKERFWNKAASQLLNHLQSKHLNSNFKLNLKKPNKTAGVFKQNQCIECQDLISLCLNYHTPSFSSLITWFLRLGAAQYFFPIGAGRQEEINNIFYNPTLSIQMPD